ncbi:MAG: hypothetical protein Q4G26_15180, partial [Paracoccus sp. (in: a-proteobacteria)]|nr:hypothetical protein [Paracoccus sp. (in: a-proteobacteria)]
SGLQTGLLDGIDIDLDALVGLNYQEVARGLTLTNHMAFPSVLVVSKVTWDSLTEEERADFTAIADEALAWGAEQQVTAEANNIAKLEADIEVGRIDNGAEMFSTANDAFAATYGSNEIIARFQNQVREAAQ